MKNETPHTARLEARLPHAVKVRLRREAACRSTEETEIIRLSIEGQRQIAAAILNPPAPTPALKKAAKRYRRLFGVPETLS